MGQPPGNRLSKTDQRTGVTSNYTYDPIYQLTQVTQAGSTTETYSYDKVGNRLSSLGVSPYSYNSSNELTSTPTMTYTYDNNGNTKTNSDGTQYTWDYENRLKQVVLPGTGGTVNFKYDPFGRRVQKTFIQGSATTTTSYIYDDINVLEEIDSIGNVVVRYTQARTDRPLSELRSGTTGYYQEDGLDSTTSLTDLAGALVNTYTYDAFGSLTASSGPLTNPLRYTGREFDPETSNYEYRFRYYDPLIGRFTSEDPIQFQAGVNFYTYVRNNPVSFYDPLGLDTQKPNWWQNLKNLARECWKDIFGCGEDPARFRPFPTPFNLCNAGDIALYSGNAPNNPYKKGAESNSDWNRQFIDDCAAKSRPDKPTYTVCSSAPISYGGTTTFCYCCQEAQCKNKKK